MDATDLITVLHDFILEEFVNSNGNGQPSGPYLGFEFGTPFPDGDFRFPAGTGAYSPGLAIERLSQHVNPIPQIDKLILNPGIATVEKQYQTLLQGATAVSAGISAQLDSAKHAALVDFDATLGSLIGLPYRFHPVLAQPDSWYDAQSSQGWTHFRSYETSVPLARPSINPKLLSWQVAPEAVRQSLAAPVTSARVNAVRASLAQIHQAPVITSPVAAHLNLGLSHLTEPPAHSTNPPTSPPVHITGDVHQIQREAYAVPIAAPDIFLDLDVCAVRLSRPWLSDGFLTLPDWYVPGYERAAFSNAEGPSDPGIFPLLPIACIFSRDLTIRATWPQADNQVIENSAHFGPFSLLGRSYSGETITVPGLQSIAWICAPMPVLPPASAPSAGA